MLVIDRVVFELVDQIGEIWRFDCENTALVEQQVHRLHKIVEVINMSKDIGRSNEASVPFVCDNFFCNGLAEKGTKSFDAGFIRNLSNIVSRIDAKDPRASI